MGDWYGFIIQAVLYSIFNGSCNCFYDAGYFGFQAFTIKSPKEIYCLYMASVFFQGDMPSIAFKPFLHFQQVEQGVPYVITKAWSCDR